MSFLDEFTPQEIAKILAFVIFALLVGYGVMLLLLAVASIIPSLVTGVFFLVLQIAVLVVSVLILIGIAGLILQQIIKVLGGQQEHFENALARMRSMINSATNNFAAEILTILTAVVVSMGQDYYSDSPIAKNSVTIYIGCYFFFAIQLIKRRGKRDTYLGVFFYTAPIVLALIYYLSNTSSLLESWQNTSIEERGLLGLAIITLILSFYYSFGRQSDQVQAGS